MDCPRCGLINPPEAQRCDCGYDFASRQMKSSYLSAEELESMDSPTPDEWGSSMFFPALGSELGRWARSRGRPRAGNTMIAVSGLLCVLGLVVRIVVWVLIALAQ